MIFSVKSRNDNLLEKVYIKSMKELNKYFGLNWKYNKPRIFLVKDRETIDKLREGKSEDWIVGWVNSKDVFILDKENYEKESCHKYSDDKYFRIIKHELAHIFTQQISGVNNIRPKWLWEGIAIYLADQKKKRPNKLKEFLKYDKKGGQGVYKEAGFAVEFLIKKYGKNKLLKLIKSLKNIKSNKMFKNKFKEIYGFDLKYKNFN